MAQIWVAQTDSLIGCMDSKYHYNFWRPATAITLADSGANPATQPEAGWTPVVQRRRTRSTRRRIPA